MLTLLVLAAVAGGRLFGLPRNWAVLGALAWGPAAAGVVSGQNTSVALHLAVATAAALVLVSTKDAESSPRKVQRRAASADHSVALLP